MLHKLLHPALMRVIRNQKKPKLILINEHPPIEKNVIYAVNHSCTHDFPIICEAIRRHTYVLAAKQRLRLTDYIGFILNGVVWVDRDDREGKRRAVEQMARLLEKGRNVCMYPEGTWNLTPSKPVLPLYWGIVGLAARTGIPIVPIVLEYREKSCYVKFGQALTVRGQDNKQDKINALEDALATLKWDIWERFPAVHRKELLGGSGTRKSGAGWRNILWRMRGGSRIMCAGGDECGRG